MIIRVKTLGFMIYIDKFNDRLWHKAACQATSKSAQNPYCYDLKQLDSGCGLQLVACSYLPRPFLKISETNAAL